MSGKISTSKAIQSVRTYQKDGKEQRKYSNVGWIREKSSGDIQFYVELNHLPDVTFVVFRESKNAHDEDGGHRTEKDASY